MGDKKAKKEFIVEFIEVYRGLPALWDVKCKDYANRTKKAKQYEVLIKKYREKYPDAEKQEVVKKINSLRTNFRKELKRIRDAEKSGVAPEDVEPKVWYFDEMKFLVHQATPTDSISTMDISQDVHHDNEEDRCDAYETSETDDESRQKNRKRKALDPIEEFVKLASKRLQQPQEDSDILPAAWAVELRKMDPQQQLFAKRAINEILFEGQMGTLHRNSVEINVSRVSTPYSVQPLPSPSFCQYESADASSQDTDIKMPILEIATNIPKEKVTESAILGLSKLLSEMLGKSESYCTVRVVPDQLMTFGGSTGYCGVAMLGSIGKLGVEENKTYAAKIYDYAESTFGIPKDRMYIRFQDLKTSEVGYNGTTFHQILNR